MTRRIADSSVEAVARALSPGVWWDEDHPPKSKYADVQAALRAKARRLLEIAAEASNE